MKISKKNNLTTITSIMCLFTLFLTACSNVEQSNIPEDTVDPVDVDLDRQGEDFQVKDFPLVTLDEAREKYNELEKFSIDGYLIKTQKCPPCPQDASCKICFEYVVVSSKDELKDVDVFGSNDSLEENMLAIINQGYDVDNLKLGVKYRFFVEAVSNSSTILVGHKLLDSESKCFLNNKGQCCVNEKCTKMPPENQISCEIGSPGHVECDENCVPVQICGW